MAEHVDYKGLTLKQVEESRRLHGANILTPPKKKSLWLQFAEKFRDPLIIILLAAGVLSIGVSIYEYMALEAGLGAFFEPAGIFIAIILATGLSFIFEVKAEREFDLLNQVNDEEPVEVIRDSNVTRVPKKDVVVGDIVILDAGQEIPADGHLLEATSLNVDESTLTGEPLCRKSVVAAEFDPDATYPTDMVLRGTKVMEGHAVMEVTAVGDATENGKVFKAVQLTDDIKTPLDEQLDRLGKFITKFSYTVAALVVVARVVMYLINNDFQIVEFIAHLLQSFMIAIALIVVSVPEGLPMAVTLTLAYSMRRMLKTNNLVRKMHVCETMGATTVICTDKTGTLTQNRMQVVDSRFYGDDVDKLVDLGIAANSTARLDLSDPQNPAVVGNPTEGALILWLRAKGVDYAALRHDVTYVAELPFSTERKFMASLVKTADGSYLLLVKGAPEIVYGLCQNYPAGADRATVDALLAQYQHQAMRTLGFAYAPVDAARVDDFAAALNEKRLPDDARLTFLGVTAIADPVRDDVPAAVDEVTGAGIKIKVVTGDTPGTAREIGRRIGLWNDDVDSDANIITGAEIGAMTDEQLRQRAPELKIIARARPMDKKRLVEALQADGEVVAVTGDGTNDAPALKTAHVGLSMGDGTSVAKEASDITIVDNSFASIGRAVLWGRSLYLNLQRFILFQLTVNVAACLIVLVGSFIGMQSPLTVTQMLWVNLIMDTFAAMALSALPPSPQVMLNKPRRRSDFIITRHMGVDVVGTGLVQFVVLLGLLWVFQYYDIDSMASLFKLPLLAKTEASLSGYELSMFFTIFVFLQFWNMFNARAFSTDGSGLNLKNCGEFKLIALMIVVGQIVIVTFGGDFFGVVPLRIADWAIIIGLTSLMLWVGELIRLIARLHRRP